MTVYSIVNALTEFAYVKRVELLVEGKALETIFRPYADRGSLREKPVNCAC